MSLWPGVKLKMRDTSSLPCVYQVEHSIDLFAAVPDIKAGTKIGLDKQSIVSGS